jgi:RNA polymerase sigma-70 factor (sigma-E family)
VTLWTGRRDREAGFSAYVEARHHHLWRIAYAPTGDRHRADDLLQTALEKLYVAWPRIEHLDRPDAYVRRILVRANIDESRRPWRRETSVAEPVEGRAVPDPTAQADDQQLLAAALQALTPMQRRCVVLRHWLDLSVAETAAELGIGEGSVKTHTSRGVAHLRSTVERPVQR